MKGIQTLKSRLSLSRKDRLKAKLKRLKAKMTTPSAGPQELLDGQRYLQRLQRYYHRALCIIAVMRISTPLTFPGHVLRAMKTTWSVVMVFALISLPVIAQTTSEARDGAKREPQKSAIEELFRKAGGERNDRTTFRSIPRHRAVVTYLHDH